ncbi:ArsR/SmtB family transcription factor [Paraglaciecola polaris]|uniref:Nodulation protein nolR n=1 Tax=Paraglaciecola polaris LMG 21857 TaxID=1129793 RepID=K6ZRD4_9ALTE|nr:metalloregulator ArsR/SmtB family transcription factor [Paraglaciecola polaris]GAC32857.1 nodulation protein nolR [Paraglaciecola polaris LMG 21857]
MTPEDMHDNADKAAALLKAMANPHRLLLLCLLNDGEMSVSELNQQVTIPQSSLSQHLAALRRENLVLTRRDAQTIFYTLASAEVKAIITTLYDLYCVPHD